MAIQVEQSFASIDIETYLRSLIVGNSRPELCGSVIPALLNAIAGVAEELRQSHQVALAGTANAFGDDQLNVDLIAESLIRGALTNCPSVATATSEEDPVETPVSQETPETTADDRSECYTVAFDPLDGSSIIGANWTVGTIIGIWDGTSALHGRPRDRQVAAIIGCLGPRTTVIIALNIPNERRVCFEIGLSNSDSRMTTTIVRPKLRFNEAPFKARYFAPANLRSAAENPAYARLVNRFIQSRYTLRYSGGLVPDIIHMLVKSHGVYISPVTEKSKAKLRRLYELCPIALVIECAGGRAINPEDGKDILDHELTDCDERAGFVCGTADEVQIVKSELQLET